MNPKTKRLVLRTEVIGMRILLAKKVRKEAKYTAAKMSGKNSFDFGASAKRALTDKMEVEAKPFGIVPKRAKPTGVVVHLGATLEFNAMNLDD